MRTRNTEKTGRMLNSRGHSARRTGRAAGFTLVELLIVVALIALLVSILAVALSNVRAAARKVMCMNRLHEIAFRFNLFADEIQHPDRGESERYGPDLFRLEDFQESIYQVDEFWKAGGTSHTAPVPEDNPLLCPAASGHLVKTRGLPCNQAVGPKQRVSIGFNMRLDSISVDTPFGPRRQAVRLTPRIKNRPWVPLAFDVDGEMAIAKGVEPFYSAPPAGVPGWYASGQFWFPATRHAQRCNVAFIGGHVLSSTHPAQVGGWQWSYQPPPN
jgi:prepilin-type N-terminal cleavage/methylation domain-containing protein/prepilin-type processing-associated H-X9-DG protein